MLRWYRVKFALFYNLNCVLCVSEYAASDPYTNGCSRIEDRAVTSKALGPGERLVDEFSADESSVKQSSRAPSKLTNQV